MGKKQHAKDRMFITAKEWKTIYGGYQEKSQARIRRLPFDRCAVSLLPFETPVCTKQGHVFDLVHIVPYLKKHKGRNPVTGAKLSVKELIRLNFHKNAKGKYCCPITYKVFNDNTHIVAIATTGNVYAYEAIKELNLSKKNWEDLVSGKKFTRDDIITIQDPHNFEARDINSFHHVHADDKKKKETVVNVNPAMQRVLAALPATLSSSSSSSSSSSTSSDNKRKRSGDAQSSKNKRKAAPRARETTHHYTASFTSTTFRPRTQSERRLLTDAEKRAQWYKYMRTTDKKAFVRICTNKGNMNFVIHCDLAPATCHNFLELCKRKYYDGTLFHRLIPGFMIQGGDPTGTGRGGQSAWGKEPIEDEFVDSLKHNARGILSMANSGPNTGKSQFFITFDACSWLDNKHAVFGQLVGGNEVLTKLEAVSTHKAKAKQNQPKRPLKIVSTQIYQNPFDEPFEAKDELELDKEAQQHRADMIALSKGETTMEKLAEKKRGVSAEDMEQRNWFSAPQPKDLKAARSSAGVGKYISKKQIKAVRKESKTLSLPAPKMTSANAVLSVLQKKKKQRAYGNFDNF